MSILEYFIKLNPQFATKSPIVVYLRMFLPWQYIAIVVIVSLFLFNLLYHGGYAVDDAFISFRYIDNFLNGHGLVFNSGEKVEGYTNFLWIVLLTPLMWMGISAEIAAYMLNSVCLVFVLIAIFRLATLLANNNTLAGWLALILIAGFGSFAFWFSAGMETICVATLIALANWQIIQHRKITAYSAVLFGLATLTRPDSGLYAVVAFVFMAPFWVAKLGVVSHQANDKTQLWRDYLTSGVIFALFPILHTLFRWAYYGSPLPNTYYAKMHPDAMLMWRFGLAYAERFMLAGGGLLSILALSGFFFKAYEKQRLFALMLVTQVILFMLYIMKVGGDYMLFFRFFITVAVLLSVLAGVSLCRLGNFLPKPALSAVGMSTFLGVVMALLLLNSSEMSQADGVRQGMHHNELFADWLSENFPPDTQLAMNNVGIIPFRTGMPVIDMLGLNDRHIARAKIATPRVETGTYIGHFKYDGQYVCAKQPKILIPTTVSLRLANSAQDALWQTLKASFDSDREFLRDPNCAARYEPHVKELLPNRYIVIYLRKD